MSTGGGTMAGRAALVTGASKGIGRDLAVGLAAAGASVMVNYKTDERGAEEVCRQIAESGIGSAAAAQADVGVSGQARALVERTVAEFGRIDLLVNNAGRTRFGPAHAVTDEDFDDVVNTNLRGAFFASVAAAEQMQRQGSGAIVNISSCAAESRDPRRLDLHDVQRWARGAEPPARVRVRPDDPGERHRSGSHEHRAKLRVQPELRQRLGRPIPMRRVAHSMTSSDL